MNESERHELMDRQPLIPTTPEEHLEAIRRFVLIGFDEWDNMPDGDGEYVSPDDKGITTKTDLFQLIGGCASYGLDSIKIQNQINEILQ
jgi:hypothetical protein